MGSSEWIAQVKRLGVAQVATAIGMHARKGGFAPCPACGAERRGGDDSRPPVTIGDRGGWECVSCKAMGDAVDLLSYKATGHRLREAGGEGMAAARELAERSRLVDPEGERPTRRDVPRTAAGISPRSARRTVVTRTARDTAPRRQEVGGGGGDPEVDPTGKVRGSDFAWREGLAEEAIDRLWGDPEAAPVRDYLQRGREELPGGASGRRLPEHVIRRWKLGAWRHPSGGWWVTIPLLDARSKAVVNVKFRRVPLEDGTTPKPKYMACPKRPLTLFGIGALSDDLGAPVVIVEGELDVVAADAFGWSRNVVSGTSGAGSFEEAWLDALEPYDAFVIAYDTDEAGEEGKGRAKLIELLGKERCAIATLPRKDTGECWLDEVDPDEYHEAINRARPIVGMSFVSAGTAWDEYERRHDADDVVIHGYPTFNEKLDALFGALPCGVTVITGYPGSGKAQPVDEVVLTPDGWAPIGSLRVGDEVVTADGTATRVVGVYPQGRREVFKVEFSDGVVVRADGDHLWSVRRGGLWRAAKTKTTREVKALLRTRNPKVFVPIVAPVEHRARALPIDPYVLGVLLGDGSLTNSGVRFTSADEGVVEEIRRRLPEGYVVRLSSTSSRAMDCRISRAQRGRTNEIAEALGALGLRVLSHEKRVPRAYLSASLDQRLALIRGLLDTDGHVTGGRVEFTSTSLGLAEDVADLLRSVGAVVRIWSKVPRYAYAGEVREGRRAWTVAVSHGGPRVGELFGLARKLERVRIGVRRGFRRRIVRVEPAGEAECVCIAVEHPSQLYVTRGHVVTHNTTFATWLVVEQARHGVTCALTSFEQGKMGSAAKVGRQFLGGAYADATDEERAKAREAISKLPLIFADRNGPAKIDDVLWSIRYAVRRLGAKIVLIDHLGYLIDHGSKDNEVKQIDRIMNELAELGRTLGIAILLIAHVSKVKDRYWQGSETRAHIGQLRGSQSVEGEAALGLVIERWMMNKTDTHPGEPGVKVHNDKQRTEDGMGGGSSQSLYFCPRSCTYSDRWELLPSARFAPARDPDPFPSVGGDTGGRGGASPRRTTRTARQ